MLWYVFLMPVNLTFTENRYNLYLYENQYFMKTIVTLALFCSCFSIFGQIGALGGAGNPLNTGRTGGVDRRIGMTPGSMSSTKSPEEIEKERVLGVEKLVEQMKTKLNLDELQLIIVKKELDASSKSMYRVIKNEKSQTDKVEEIKAIYEQTDRVIMGFLNDDQKKIFKEMIEERNNPNPVEQKSSRKKKKEKKEETNETPTATEN